MIHPPPRPARSVLLGASAILAYSVWYWSIGYFGATVSREGLEAGLQLVLAALGFTAIGHSVLSPVVTGYASRLIPGLSMLVCSTVVGQLACVVWAVLRSGVSGLAFYQLGRKLPITAGKLLLLGCVLVAVALRTNRLHHCSRRAALRFGVVGLQPQGVRLL